MDNNEIMKYFSNEYVSEQTQLLEDIFNATKFTEISKLLLANKITTIKIENSSKIAMSIDYNGENTLLKVKEYCKYIIQNKVINIIDLKLVDVSDYKNIISSLPQKYADDNIEYHFLISNDLSNNNFEHTFFIDVLVYNNTMYIMSSLDHIDESFMQKYNIFMKFINNIMSKNDNLKLYKASSIVSNNQRFKRYDQVEYYENDNHQIKPVMIGAKLDLEDINKMNIASIVRALIKVKLQYQLER